MNQATENIGNTPRSFLRMRIAIDIVKKIAISVAPFLIVCVFNYSRIVALVKYVIYPYSHIVTTAIDTSISCLVYCTCHYLSLAVVIRQGS